MCVTLHFQDAAVVFRCHGITPHAACSAWCMNAACCLALHAQGRALWLLIHEQNSLGSKNPTVRGVSCLSSPLTAVQGTLLRVMSRLVDDS